jgi:hypothetical protein
MRQPPETNTNGGRLYFTLDGTIKRYDVVFYSANTVRLSDALGSSSLRADSLRAGHRCARR